MDYLGAFLVGGYGGWVLEAVQDSACYDRALAKIGLDWLPFKVLYGVGLALLVLIYKTAPTSNLLLLALLCSLVFTLLECGNGLIGEKIYGKRGWTYDTCDSFCNKYNSIRISAAWFGLALVALIIVKKVIKK